MPGKDIYTADLQPLVMSALQTGKLDALERYLLERAKLQDSHLNMALIESFGALIGRIVTQPDMPPVENIEAMLDCWAALLLTVDDARILLPAVAVMSYGHVAVARPDWWDDEMTKLHRAASHPHKQVREAVVAAFQALLATNPERTRHELTTWLKDGNTLVVETVTAALRQPA